MVRKCFNLIIEKKGTKEIIGKFLFDENDNKGLETKAHLVTIDQFTTAFKSDSNLLNFYADQNKNIIKVETLLGRIYIPDHTLYLVHNANGVKKEKPLYSQYSEITDIPLVDLITCDKNSKEFKEYYYNFKWLLLNEPRFYKEIINSNYYHNALKEEIDAVINGYKVSEFHEKLLIAYLSKYSIMRKSYKEVIDYNKKL